MRKLDEYKPGQEIEWYDARGRWRAGVVHKICTESHPRFIVDTAFGRIQDGPIDTTTEVTISTESGMTKLSDPYRVRLPGEFLVNEQVEVTYDDGKTYRPAAFVKHDDVKGWCQVLDGSGICPTTTKLSNVRPLIPMEEQLAAARKSIEALEQKNKSQAKQIEELQRANRETACDLANTKNELDATKKALLEAARERDNAKLALTNCWTNIWGLERRVTELEQQHANQKNTIESFQAGGYSPSRMGELERQLSDANHSASVQKKRAEMLRAELDALNARVMQAQKILEGR